MLNILKNNAKVIVQGGAGLEGQFHTSKMIEYGTNIVAGVDPAANVAELNGLPLYKKISDVIKDKGQIDVSVIFVPAPFVMDAAYEAANNGIKFVIIITEGVPLNDAIKIKNYFDARGVKLIGPNCPGLIIPDVIKLGILPGHICKKGNVGIISKSGTLTYEVVAELGKENIGQSACIGIGGDPVIGTNYVDLLKFFKDDDQTDAVVIIGEIGGDSELIAADYIAENYNKPVCAFIAGKCAPKEKTMGHAGAIVSGKGESADEKMEYLESKGITVAQIPSEIGKIVAGFNI